MKRNELKLTIMALCLTQAFFSCSLNYDRSVNAQDVIPELSFENAQFNRYVNGKLEINVKSESLEQYKDSGKLFAKNVDFSTVNANNEISSSAHCSLLSADTRTNEFLMLDGISISDFDRNVQITAQNLLWNSQTEQLTGTKDSSVSVIKGNTELSGIGFSASAISGSFRFSSAVSGHSENEINETENSNTIEIKTEETTETEN